MAEGRTKPLVVRRQEFMEQIVHATNNSGLPAFVMADVLERLTEKLRELENVEYSKAISLYREQLREESVKTSPVKD